MDGKRLDGEIAAVTGSDSGIGQATAIAFAQEGRDYFKDRQRAEHVVQQRQKAGRRPAPPEEIANAAVFPASNDAHYIHGTTLVIDGALMLYQGPGA